MRKIFAIIAWVVCMMVLFPISAATKSNSANAIVSMKVLPLPDNRVRILFNFKQPIQFQPASFVTQKPARIVFDFLNTQDELPDEDKIKTLDIGVVKKMAVVQSQNRTRAVVDLKELVTYKVRVMGRQMSVTLIGKKSGIPMFAKRQFFTPTHNVRTKHYIRNIDFRGIGQNGGKVIIEVSDPNMAIDVRQKGQNIRVSFFDTRLPRKFLRKLDVGDFHTPAKLIDAQQKGKVSQINIINKGDFGHFAYQVNKDFIVEIFPLTPDEIAKAKLKKKVFTGKRISLNFQDIRIRSVLQLLAEFTGINMVVSDSVAGSITLRLNNIPWDQALDIILKTKGLDKRKVGNVILVAPTQEIAAREKQELEAQLQAEELAPLRSELIQINYAKAIDVASLLKEKDNSILSERGSVSVDTRTNTIWVQDTSKQIKEIRELVSQLDKPVKQVLIEARVVIVNKDFEKDLGVRFGVSRPTHLSGTLDGANQLAGGTAPAAVDPFTRRLNVDLAALPVSGNPASIGIALAKLGDGVLLDLELSALESEGLAEIISSPRLITANQQAALIESGEEIPYQEATSSGATSVAFKKAVLSLKVTPQITPDNKIVLDLKVNQDSDTGRKVLGVPIINTKEVETNVLVDNGQTIVLGGIYKQDKKETVTRVPFLGSIPLVGVLFRRNQDVIKHEELLIFITPKIIMKSFVTN